MPRRDADLTAWACVACDQFTSEPHYWEEAGLFVGDKPSTLKLMVPECYLGEAERRIPRIHTEMQGYLAQGVVEAGVRDGFILTERSTGNGVRVGLVALMDLEGYDYRVGSTSLIRATEGTILERIPPRVQARRGAALEMSHVLMLLSDPMKSVVEPLYERRHEMKKLYDFPLMMEGGHVAGYAVMSPEEIAAVFDALLALKARLTGENPLLYAVGDGNHSLAAAKAYWEEIKPGLSLDEQEGHPARFALVELENIHQGALEFEPIHRVAMGCDGNALLEEWERYARSRGMTNAGGGGSQEIVCVCKGKAEVTVNAGDLPQTLAVGALQAFLDEWLTAHPTAKLDYVHGEAAVRALVERDNAIGFLLPRPDKNSLFETVRRDGALPRKAFSMGEARQKRYYLETRKL